MLVEYIYCYNFKVPSIFLYSLQSQTPYSKLIVKIVILIRPHLQKVHVCKNKSLHFRRTVLKLIVLKFRELENIMLVCLYLKIPKIRFLNNIFNIEGVKFSEHAL